MLVADSHDPAFVPIFDGASTYNITNQTQHKSPPEIWAWAHATYPEMIAAAGSGKISTVSSPAMTTETSGACHLAR
jgi:hypothetical protein